MAGRGRKTLSTIWALARCEDARLSPPHKLLWVLYRSYDTKGEGAFAGDEILAAHMGKSARSVQGYRADLLEWGYLQQQLRGPKPAFYWAVLPPELAATIPEELRDGGPAKTTTRRNGRPGRRSTGQVPQRFYYAADASTEDVDLEDPPADLSARRLRWRKEHQKEWAAIVAEAEANASHGPHRSYEIAEQVNQRVDAFLRQAHG